MEGFETEEPVKFDSTKPDESILWQVYVLELQHGCYYIGIAFDIEKRFQAHVAGEGANFTRIHKPIRIIEQFCSGTCDRKKAQKIETQKTLEYAVKFGADKVKGGRYLVPSKLMRKVKHLRNLELNN